MFLLLIAGCTRVHETPCIVVGETTLDTQAFRERLERFAEESMIDSREVLEQMKPHLTATLVEEMLILEYARRQGLSVSDEELSIAMQGFTDGISAEDLDQVLAEEYRTFSDMQHFVRTRTLVKKAIDKAVRSTLVVSPDEVRQTYEQRRDTYHRPSSVELYHVFVTDKLKAKEALVMLRSGVPLGHVVSQYSISDDVKDNGFMGVFVKGELPREVEEVVFSIPERRYSGIIETVRGYHIFYVERRTAPGIAPFEEVRGEIRDSLTEERFEAAYKQWVDTLRLQYQPEVNWNEIKSVSIY